MPAEGPGERYSVTATKAAIHGDPVTEKNHAGIAAKSSQAQGGYPTAANAVAATRIAIGEEMVIMMDGLHPVASSLLPGGAAAGDPIYIRKADNVLVNAAEALTAGVLEAAYNKFGLISAIDTTLGVASINLEQRSAF